MPGPDATEEDAVHDLVQGIVTECGRLDALVTGAGTQARGELGAPDATTLPAA